MGYLYTNTFKSELLHLFWESTFEYDENEIVIKL